MKISAQSELSDVIAEILSDGGSSMVLQVALDGGRVECDLRLSILRVKDNIEDKEVFMGDSYAYCDPDESAKPH